MTDRTVELEQVRDEAIQMAKDLEGRSAVIGVDQLAESVAELARHVATIAHHAAGEIRNRRLTTNTP